MEENLKKPPLETEARKCVVLMHELKRGVKDSFGRSSEDSSKSDHNVYLLESQWQLLDEVGEATGKSRNQVCRDLISDYFRFPTHTGSLKKDITIAVLKELRVGCQEEVSEAIQIVEDVIQHRTDF